LERVVDGAGRLSRAINWVVERLCVLLLVLLVLDVWLGVLSRYVLPLSLTFTEELARYLMIWMALLAVSGAVVHRQHIGVGFVFERFQPRLRRWLSLIFSLIGCVFFLVLLWYGLGLVQRGMNRVTMIFAMPRGYAFAAVPVAAGLAALQLLLMGIQDFWGRRPPAATGSSVAAIGPDEVAR
jgi:TRAP-type transport system small permease protein